MATKKDEKKTLDVTVIRATQRVTTVDGELKRTRLNVGDEVNLPRADARALIACGKAKEGKYGADIKKAQAAAAKQAAA